MSEKLKLFHPALGEMEAIDIVLIDNVVVFNDGDKFPLRECIDAEIAKAGQDGYDAGYGIFDAQRDMLRQEGEELAVIAYISGKADGKQEENDDKTRNAAIDAVKNKIMTAMKDVPYGNVERVRGLNEAYDIAENLKRRSAISQLEKK